jgi:hypothetical protein
MGERDVHAYSQHSEHISSHETRVHMSNSENTTLNRQRVPPGLYIVLTMLHYHDNTLPVDLYRIHPIMIISVEYRSLKKRTNHLSQHA